VRSLTASNRRGLPPQPLLHAYSSRGLPSIAELHQLPGLGSRFAAILGATARFLYPDFLGTASEDTFREALVRFYEAVHPLPLHTQTVRRRAGFLRHALAHFLHGQDPMPAKLEACLSSSGAYRVAGLGPAFWSALAQGLAPARYPGWTCAMRLGMERLGLVAVGPGCGPADVYRALIRTHARLRAARPELTSLHLDHFLSLVATMVGRDLFAAAAVEDPIEPLLKRLRAMTPLRQLLKQRGQALADAQVQLEAGLATQQGSQLGQALAIADPVGAGRSNIDWDRHAEWLLIWVGRLWECDDPYPLLAAFWVEEPIPGAGLWLPAAVLHLRDPQRFIPFGDLIRQGLAKIDDGVDPGDAPTDRYRLANEAAAYLRDRYTIHPLELPSLLEALAGNERSSDSERGVFSGFCADTFAFLAELARENRRTWMNQARDRYLWAVREPLTNLCQALATRYVEPILGGLYGWQLDTLSRNGRALTSICKNNYGRTSPYTSTVWITFCQRGIGRKGVQLFVRLAPEGLRFGLRLGRGAVAVRAQLRRNIERYTDTLLSLLRDKRALETCRFGLADLPATQADLTDGDSLRRWARGRTLEASCSLEADDPVHASEDLVGRIVVVFDQLVPLFACCVEEDAGPTLTRLGGTVQSQGYGEADFRRQTYLNDDWLRRARELLSLKKQLILQGVPGTGKTHVARCLGRLLTGGHDEAVRLVQFHPAYSYEEFVEGIRVRTINVDGRNDITYPVEDGLLCAFAARAAARPGQPHVLIVDEINRGNLPRIFGELLYLLEYRGQAVELPYSRRDFQLPANLYFVATMNAADRSLALVDQALRRRFSFVQMDPDTAVLAAWLREHPPEGGPAFAARVVSLFERLNARLLSEVGPNARIGHSYFMVTDLNEARLGMIWQHHVRPHLDEVCAGQPGRSASFDQLLESGRSRSARVETISHP
jgi:MoxR-like ATPase